MVGASFHFDAYVFRHEPMPTWDVAEGAGPVEVGLRMTARTLDLLTDPDVWEIKVAPPKAAKLRCEVCPELDRLEGSVDIKVVYWGGNPIFAGLWGGFDVRGRDDPVNHGGEFVVVEGWIIAFAIRTRDEVRTIGS